MTGVPVEEKSAENNLTNRKNIITCGVILQSELNRRYKINFNDISVKLIMKTFK
jgi:hypothetical protein